MKLQHFNLHQAIFTFAIGISLGFLPQNPATAQVRTIEQQDAQTKPTSVYLKEGEADLIGFENDEIITFILLSDPSKNVYNSDAPIESGQARTITLRQIEEIDIPGATSTKIPNMFVQTVDAQGKVSRYQFNIYNDSQEQDDNQIAIIPTKLEPKPNPKPKVIPPPKNNIQTSLGEATPEDILLGLDTVLKKGKLLPEDPLVFQINEYAGMTMNGFSANQAIEKVEVPLSILQKIGSIGLQEDTRRRLLPLPPTIFPEKTSNSNQKIY
jgi:hypothetical protein